MIPKFRAWGRDGNYPGTPSEKFEMFYDVSVVTTFNDKMKHVIADFGMYNESEYNGTEILDYILMQSTGLTDENGKEIFEGDILGTKDGLLNGVVKFNIDLGMWTNSLIRYNNFERLCNVASSRKIIGNMWEDGELLDGENTEEN